MMLHCVAAHILSVHLLVDGHLSPLAFMNAAAVNICVQGSV